MKSLLCMQYRSKVIHNQELFKYLHKVLQIMLPLCWFHWFLENRNISLIFLEKDNCQEDELVFFATLHSHLQVRYFFIGGMWTDTVGIPSGLSAQKMITVTRQHYLCFQNIFTDYKPLKG